MRAYWPTHTVSCHPRSTASEHHRQSCAKGARLHTLAYCRRSRLHGLGRCRRRVTRPGPAISSAKYGVVCQGPDEFGCPMLSQEKFVVDSAQATTLHDRCPPVREPGNRPAWDGRLESLRRAARDAGPGRGVPHRHDRLCQVPTTNWQPNRLAPTNTW